MGSQVRRHVALIYRDPAEYAAAVNAFVQTGRTRGEPVFIAVPSAHWQVLGQPPFGDMSDGAAVTLADMEERGRNPARIISAIREFADLYPGRAVRYVGEPLWPSRTLPEQEEIARLEALLNVAFPDGRVAMMCAYNASTLPSSAISAARQCHPSVLSGGEERSNPAFNGSYEVASWLDSPLPQPPTGVQELDYDCDLRPLRAFVAAAADSAGLTGVRRTDLVIAASEIGANTLRHTAGGGVLRIWQSPAEIICQLDDGGYITDPLAGQFKPGRNQAGGHGLWLVNQVCDLVQIRTSNLGTTVRLHMRRG
jgi:anti-sigma regulatory factor (Ser/Thr protein kinase)